MGAEGQRNCGERGRGVGWGSGSGLQLFARPGREVALGSVSLCVFGVGVRGAPGLVFESKGPGGRGAVQRGHPGPWGRAGGLCGLGGPRAVERGRLGTLGSGRV
jgi:hypothetical protein